jgi:hypothetical protein
MRLASMPVVEGYSSDCRTVLGGAVEMKRERGAYKVKSWPSRIHDW